MEGLEALVLAGNVIQFVEFAFKFVSRIHVIYTEAWDEGRNRVRLQNMLKDFVLVAARLDRAPAIQVDGVPPSDDVHNKVQGISEGGKGRIWRSVAAAIQEAWTGSDLEELLKELKVYQDSLQFHVLISVRESIEFLSQRQNDQFLESNAVMEKLIEVLDRVGHQSINVNITSTLMELTLY
ncbi:hypothetical protein V8F06_014831, partial [Rhypophila decipiens]